MAVRQKQQFWHALPAASSAASSGSDDRLGAVVRRATLLGAPVLEATRLDLKALTDGAAHQGVAIEVPAYEYADARDLLKRFHHGVHGLGYSNIFIFSIFTCYFYSCFNNTNYR